MRRYELDTSYQGNMPNEVEFTLDDRYVVKIGDERFYNLMGETMLSAFNGLVHPDDVMGFEQFINSDMSVRYYIVRCLIKNGSYRWMLLVKKRIYEVGTDRMVELVAQDIIVISNDFDMYYHRVRKYRAIINVIDEKIFEYDPVSGMITIYCYRNNKSEIFERTSLKEWKEACITKGFVTGDDAVQFEALCTAIASGMNNFIVKLSSSVMSKGERVDNLIFRGQSLLADGENRITVGVISEPDRRTRTVQEYVGVDEAKLDLATGIYNKKTVTDMITDDINKTAVSDRNRQMFLMILDIDNFKSVNDSYGHYFGDEVIKAFADSLKLSVGGRGIVGRIGGDEFIVLIKDVTIEELRIMLKAMRKGLKVSLGMMTVKEVLSELTDKLNIHGISIYSGNDMECIYSTGHYKNNVIEAAYVNDDKFVNHFDEYGVNMVNNIASLTIEFPEVFRKLRDNNICSFLQMKADGADGKEYMVEFDIFGTNRRKWSDTDVIMLRMVVLGVVNAISGQLTD